MKNSTYDSLMIGLDVLIGGALLAVLVITMTAMGKFNDTQTKEQMTREEISYYREFNQYDNTVVTQSDVVSAILRWKGSVPVTVQCNGNIYHYSSMPCTVTGHQHPIDYKASVIQNLLNSPSSKFNATIEMSPSGQVTSITFIKQ